MTASKIFFCFCIAFIIGIGISSFVKFSLPVLLVFLILGLVLISVFWSYKKIAVLGFCIIFLVLGIWRHQTAELKFVNDELRKYNDKEEKITLIGEIISEPDIKGKSIQLKFGVSQIQSENGSRSIEGKVLVAAGRYPEYQYGDRLKIKGYLQTPPLFEGFNYQDYLKKDGIYSVMSWPEIELSGRNSGNPIYKILFSFKNKFKKTAQSFISPPQEGILEALIFGDEENIPKDWKEKLNITGLRHITAVSGMNITIISFLILSFALNLGLWRKQAFLVSIFLIFLYILMIGAPPSGVRAGIMAGLLMTAQYFGRLSRAGRAIIFAGTLMLIINPFLLRLDIGFQLSFLATIGIIYLQKFFTDFLKKIPDPKIFPIKTTLVTTFSALLFTLPILIYNFGYFPLLSPAANILIVPFLAFFTILIFIFGIAGIIFPFLGWIFSLPIWLCLTYIVKIIDFFSRIPFATIKLKAPWQFLLIFYLILGIVVWLLQKKQKLKFLKY